MSERHDGGGGLGRLPRHEHSATTTKDWPAWRLVPASLTPGECSVSVCCEGGSCHSVGQPAGQPPRCGVRTAVPAATVAGTAESRHIQPGSTAYPPGGRPAHTHLRAAPPGPGRTRGGPPGPGPAPPAPAVQRQRGCGPGHPTRHPGLSCSSNNWVARGAVDNRVLLCRCGLWCSRRRVRLTQPSLPGDPRPGGPPGPPGTDLLSRPRHPPPRTRPHMSVFIQFNLQ